MSEIAFSFGVSSSISSQRLVNFVIAVDELTDRCLNFLIISDINLLLLSRREDGSNKLVAEIVPDVTNGLRQDFESGRYSYVSVVLGFFGIFGNTSYLKHHRTDLFCTNLNSEWCLLELILGGPLNPPVLMKS